MLLVVLIGRLSSRAQVHTDQNGLKTSVINTMNTMACQLIKIYYQTFRTMSLM